MDVSPTVNGINAGFALPSPISTGPTAGTSTTSQSTVNISPQARILQQTDQNQQELSQAVQEATEALQEPVPVDFIRVSTSVGQSVQANSLTAEEALELYRSIQGLI